jgi:hypothetical protein
MDSMAWERSLPALPDRSCCARFFMVHGGSMSSFEQDSSLAMHKLIGHAADVAAVVNDGFGEVRNIMMQSEVMRISYSWKVCSSMD